MKIAIVGLGLIGGSVAKAFKKFTDYHILGYDKNDEVLKKALSLGAIDEKAEDFCDCDIIVLGLYPKAAIKFMQDNAYSLNKNSVICDVGGVKREVCDGIYPIAKKHNLTFVGMHPMAGIEKSGFDFSFAEMFQNASLIMTPYPKTDNQKIELLKNAFLKLGFAKIQMSTPAEHDKIIAYTSQLAHVVSASYIKSPTAQKHLGFSAGSFKDMTRVAHLNEEMWTELFLENSENLTEEIDYLTERLTEFSKAIKAADRDTLFELLRDGRIKKDLSDGMVERKLQ